MQVLGASGGAQSSGNSAEPNASNNISHANSALSIDFNEQGASIIGKEINPILIMVLNIKINFNFRLKSRRTS